MARLVARWVRAYTRGLPGPAAGRRAQEVEADVHDHIAHERAQGTGEGRIALGIASRMVRGAAADAVWRRRHAPRGAGRSVVRVACATAAVLLVPAVATLAGGAAWGPLDFVLAAVALTGAGLALELMLARRGEPAYRWAAALAIGAALLLAFLLPAVGVLGETGAPGDAMYLAVLGVLAVGAVAARLRPRGMAWALLAAALAQAAVAAVALAAGVDHGPAAQVVGVNAMFVGLFLASAALFMRAAGPRRSPA